MNHIKDRLFSEKSRQSLIGSIAFYISDIRKKVISLTVFWSRIPLPEDEFKENVFVEIKESGSEKYYRTLGLDRPHVFSVYTPIAKEKEPTSRAITLLNLSRNKEIRSLSDVRRWLSNRRGFRDLEHVFKEVYLDISCLLNRKVKLISANTKIPAVLLLYEESIYYIITDNRRERVPAFYYREGDKSNRFVSTLNKNEEEITNHFISILKRKFPSFTKDQLRNFLVSVVLNRVPGFSLNYYNFLREDYLLVNNKR